MRKYCVFILTHGRADNVITLRTLKKQGYTGEWFMVVDDQDEQKEKYLENFGNEHVCIFSKDDIEKKFDTMDLSKDRRTVVYARNACFDIAEERNFDYFLELDDDYSAFSYRFVSGKKFRSKKIESLDVFFEKMFSFLDQSWCVSCAIAQGGDFIGGKDNPFFWKGLARKCMNTFFCKTSKRFDFIGRINEDVNTYTTCAQRGELMFTYTKADINQQQTQKNKGGMSEIYLDSGTYLKSFYSVMCSPSCVKVATMGDKHKRMHHSIDWDFCAPKILNEKYRKKGRE